MRLRSFRHKAEKPVNNAAQAGDAKQDESVYQIQTDAVAETTTDVESKADTGSVEVESESEPETRAISPGIDSGLEAERAVGTESTDEIEHDVGIESSSEPESPVKTPPVHKEQPEYDVNRSLSNENACFLGLPYELRIEIYRLVLLRSGRTTIDTIIPPEPGLLGVNEQIREEASEIYYSENTFKGHIFHFDAALYLRWRSLSRFKPCHATCKWKVRSSHNFANLKAWLKADFEDDEQDLGLTLREDGKATVDIGAFDLARKLKAGGASWEEIEPLLEPVLSILIATDKRWKRE